MKQNICIVLNSKNKRDAIKEMYKIIDLFKEDKHLDTECESWITKSIIEKEYEDFKQEYRNLPNIQDRLDDWGEHPDKFKDIEEYIAYVLEGYGWSTLEDYSYMNYNIIRFEGEKAIVICNPKGYIDYVDHIISIKKIKYLTNKKIKSFRISELILKDKSVVSEDLNKSYKLNKLILKQALNKYANNNDYIAIVRVHF